MSVKEEISREYAVQQMVKHAAKDYPTPRRALVIGAEPDNIGWAISSELLRRMTDVFTPTKQELDVTCDVGPRSLRWHMERYRDGGYTPDTLILANGETHLDWIEDQPADSVRDVIANSLTGSIQAAATFAEFTMDDPWRKQVVFIGSMAHRNVLNASAPYCAAKAGLHHFARCIGWELAPKGFDVYIVHPSNVEGTPMTQATIEGIARYRNTTLEAARAYWAAVNVQERWLNPQDIAEVVADLTSGSAAWKYATGTAIELTGGQR